MITIGIPTFNRGEILVSTIARLFPLGASAILVADQTSKHPAAVESQLSAWAAAGSIRWLRLPEPSIPHAMNVLLEAARTPLVLFLDDDIEPGADLVRQHVAGHADLSVWAVAGQVLQPGERAAHHPDPGDDLEFRFSHDTQRLVSNVMAGNLSVKRDRALEIGGFDENFVGAAYRFESDFALRLVAGGGQILFAPTASLRHLQLSSGGLRSFGDHRTSPSPMHSVGDYYFALRHRPGFLRYAAKRIVRNVATRYHLMHPWAIPSKLVGEARGMMLAARLDRQGPRLSGNSASTGGIPTDTP